MMKYTTTTYVAPNGEKRMLTAIDWSTFRVDELMPEITALIAEGRVLAEKTANIPVPTFADLVTTWEEFNERFGRVVGPMHHLNSVMQSSYPGLREVIKDQVTPVLSVYGTDLSLHEGMYNAHLRFKESEEYKSLRADQKHIIDESIKNYTLAGVGLSPEKKAELKELNERSEEFSQTFNNNKLAVQDAWELIVTDESRLRGIPEDTKRAMQESAKAKGKDGWRITLQQPDVIAVLEYADDRSLREEIARANGTIASELDQFKGVHDNAPIIAKLLSLAHQEANILGYANYAEMSLEKKMAKSVGVDGVARFLSDLNSLARPKAEGELSEEKAFALEKYGITDFAPWDHAYVAEKMRVARYDIDKEAIKQYFPLSRVNAALSDLLFSLYGVRLVLQPDIKGWNEDVKFYTLVDEDGGLRAGCYIDLYAREGKRSGAWMNELVSRVRLPDGVQVPVAYLICNYMKPAGGGDVYLEHDELTTYFHEFGHCLHLMLTAVDYSSLAMGGVEWDTVELPSQFMENFCWDKDMLKQMSCHKVTGAQIPDTEIDKMFAAKYFNTGLFTNRQVLFGLFDWELYGKYDPAAPVDANQLWRDIQTRYGVMPFTQWGRFPNNFGHIFGGGYSAGYFSYMWALGLAADAYAVFEESGNIRSREVGMRFAKEVLGPGCSRPMAESFRAFRGRDLDPHALAKELGLLQK